MFPTQDICTDLTSLFSSNTSHPSPSHVPLFLYLTFACAKTNSKTLLLPLLVQFVPFQLVSTAKKNRRDLITRFCNRSGDAAPSIRPSITQGLSPTALLSDCDLSVVCLFCAEKWLASRSFMKHHTVIGPNPMCFNSPVVLIMLLGVAVAAAKMLGVLPTAAAPLVMGVPTVLTDRLPGGGFLTGTTTLLQKQENNLGLPLQLGKESDLFCDLLVI